MPFNCEADMRPRIADIELPPRDILVYLENIFPKRLREYRAEIREVIEDAKDTVGYEEEFWNLDIEKLIEVGEEVLRSADDASMYDRPLAELIREAEYQAKLLPDKYGAEKAQSVEILISEIDDFLRADLGSEVKWIKEDRRDITDTIDYIEEKMSRADANKLRSILDLPEIWADLESFLETTVDKLETYADYVRGNKPEPADIEHLYHASVNAREIAQQGFEDEVPGEGGLGGAQSTGMDGSKGTSFTADLYVAKEIMRALKEVVMIAHGKLGMRGVVEMAKRYNVLDKVRDRIEARRALEKKEPRIEDVFEVYNTVLWFSDRYNPVFWDLDPRDFLDVQRSDVGIVEAAVNMNHPDISYEPAMEEYRVPPEAILEVTDFIQ